MTKSEKVIVYCASWCHWCHKVVDLLKAHKIPHEARDVAEGGNAKECMEKSGQAGIPVTIIGKEVVVGYDEKKIKELLKIK